MRLLLILLLVVFISLQYKLWFGAGSMKDWMSLKEKTTLQLQQNKRLHAKNEALLTEVEALKNGDQTIEEQARQTLGMVRDDEVYFQVVDPH